MAPRIELRWWNGTTWVEGRMLPGSALTFDPSGHVILHNMVSETRFNGQTGGSTYRGEFFAKGPMPREEIVVDERQQSKPIGRPLTYGYDESSFRSSLSALGASLDVVTGQNLDKIGALYGHPRARSPIGELEDDRSYRKQLLSAVVNKPPPHPALLPLPTPQLTAEQMAQLYAPVSQYNAFEYDTGREMKPQPEKPKPEPIPNRKTDSEW